MRDVIAGEFTAKEKLNEVASVTFFAAAISWVIEF
jgi:hypothetical protein